MNIPIPPPLTLVPTKIGDYQLYKLKHHLAMLNGQPQYSGSAQEVSIKYKKLYDKNQAEASTVTQPTQQVHINITLYSLCQRCNRWLLKSEQTIHMSCHAAIVLQNLLLGDKFSSQSKKELIQRHNVTHVVNAADQLNNYLEKQGIQYLKLKLFDNMTEKVIPQSQKAAQWIKKAHQKGGRVFVHCAMGKSRSVSVILIYLMKYHGKSLDQSLSLVKEVRPLAKPNPSYMKQLRQFQQGLRMKQKYNQQ